MASHPARGTWIEIDFIKCIVAVIVVAPRTGYVD